MPDWVNESIKYHNIGITFRDFDLFLLKKQTSKQKKPIKQLHFKFDDVCKIRNPTSYDYHI